MVGPELALALLALCLLRELLPPDLSGALVLVSLAAPQLFARLAERWPRRSLELVGGACSAVALGGLALLSPEVWLQASLSAALVIGGGVVVRVIRVRTGALALGVGLLAPLTTAVIIGSISPSAKTLLLGALGDWQLDFGLLKRLAQWLALSVAVLFSMKLPRVSQKVRWLAALAGVVIALVLAVRVAWLITVLSLPTDLMIWSEPPLLLNLLKLHAGEVFYGPPARLNSYSYSPALEHLQYALLRPLGLELSLRAHRALGVLWQVTAALCLALAVGRRLGITRSARWLLPAACMSLLLSSLLAPHLHPDHLLMLCLAGSFWLLTCERRPAHGLWLLVLLPPLATMVKLTGAGVGVGLVLVYAWERDVRCLALLGLAAVLALGTIGLFDATLGNFSDYAIRLQAAHAVEVDRLLGVWATPPLLLFWVALLVCGLRSRAAPGASSVRAAQRTILLTLGIGLTSLVAYAKHGGRDNSLLPFTLGGMLALLLALADAAPHEPSRDRSSSLWLYPVLAASLALVTPFAAPVLGAPRAELLQMHATAVEWLAKSAREKQRVMTASTAAHIAAGLRHVPDTSLATISELALAGRPEVAAFKQRVRRADYDSLLLPASSLYGNPTIKALLPSLQERYVVVAPRELAGAWPSGLGGYVILSRRAPNAGAPDRR
jgi:hypothetical protein